MVKKRVMGSLYFDGTPVAVGSEYDGGELTISDTALGKKIIWIAVNGLLIADRCICMYISARQLEDQGFAKGKAICIDGRRYLCRLLKVGNAPGVPNEWDTALDATSGDNKLWHWKDAFFWGQEAVELPSANRAFRGYISARYWDHDSVSYRRTYVGFRPALEPLRPDNLNSDK